MLKKALFVLSMFVWAAPAWSQPLIPRKGKRPTAQLPRFLTEAVAEKKDAEAPVETDVEIRLADTAEAVKVAFEDRDVSVLASTLVAKRKINLSLRFDQEEKGHYGSAQIRFIFERLFDKVLTQSFEVEPSDLRPRSGTRAEFRAKWRFLVVDSGEELTSRLSFKLTLDKGADAWRIHSISDR